MVWVQLWSCCLLKGEYLFFCSTSLLNPVIVCAYCKTNSKGVNGQPLNIVCAYCETNSKGSEWMAPLILSVLIAKLTPRGRMASPLILSVLIAKLIPRGANGHPLKWNIASLKYYNYYCYLMSYWIYCMYFSFWLYHYSVRWYRRSTIITMLDRKYISITKYRYL